MPADPREELVRRLFAIQQVSNTLVGQSDEVLRAMFDEIVAAIVKLDPTAVAPRYQQGRLDALAKRVREIVGPTYDDLYREQRALLASVGAREAQATTASLRAILGAGAAGKVAPTTGLGPNFFKALVDTQPLQGALLSDWFKDQSRKTVFNVDRQIRLGMLNGDSVGDLVRRVRGRSAGKRGQYVGGVMQTSTKDAESIVRTAVNDIGNTARMNTFAANADIVATTTFVATLDSRTSPECQAADGKRWKLDDPAIQRPPLHIRCRSTLVPDIDWESLGLEPPPEGTRASADGQVAASTTYEQWLKGQPKAVQDEILGPGRAELFRQDRVTLKQLVTTDGRRVPLDELRGAGVVRFASVSDAEKWAAEAMPGAQIDFGGMDLTVADEVARQAARLTGAYPRAPISYLGGGDNVPDGKRYDWIHRRAADKDDDARGSSVRDAVWLNRRFTQDGEALRRELASDVSVGWSARGRETPAALFTHEYGHVLDASITRRFDADSQRIAGKLQAWKTRWRSSPEAVAIGEYATADDGELFAEAFAQLTHAPATAKGALFDELRSILSEASR